MKKLSIIFLLIIISALFCSYVYPMDSSEVMEYEGKIVNIDFFLIPTTPEIGTLYNIEILRVFLHPEQLIPNYYVAVRYNNGYNYKGKTFILPCEIIVHIREVKRR